MSESMNGAPPAPPQGQQLPQDVGMALLYFDLAVHVLTGMANQMNHIGQQSPVLLKARDSFGMHVQLIQRMRADLLQAAQSAIVIAAPGDVPPRRLQ